METRGVLRMATAVVLFFIFETGMPGEARAASIAERLSGRILLQVEARVKPGTSFRETGSVII